MSIFTKISLSMINVKNKNGSRLIAEYNAFTIHVDQVDFLHKKFGASALAELGL